MTPLLQRFTARLVVSRPDARPNILLALRLLKSRHLGFKRFYPAAVSLDRFDETIKSGVQVMIPCVREGYGQLSGGMPGKVEILFV